MAGVSVEPRNDSPELLFDEISRAFEGRVDGILGVDLLQQFYLGLDYASERVALVPKDRPFDEVRGQWFENGFVKLGYSTKRIPWSRQPKALLPNGPLDVSGSWAASRDTIELGSVTADIYKRISVEVGSGPHRWQAMIDTGSSITTVGPENRLDGKRTARMEVVSVRGTHFLEGLLIPLNIGLMNFPPGDVFVSEDKEEDGSDSLIGTDRLRLARWLIDFSESRVVCSPNVSPKAGEEKDLTTLYFEPSRKQVVFEKPMRFPYEPGWYVLRGKATVSAGYISVNPP
ncbi:hypothetical protein EON81_05600 [bacterium]|nr:MAG: hypothetical protein EON81_05600 [bacterium]